MDSPTVLGRSCADTICIWIVQMYVRTCVYVTVEKEGLTSLPWVSWMMAVERDSSWLPVAI